MNLHCKKPQNQTHLSGSTWEKKMKLNILSFKTASQAIIWPLKVSKKESPTVTRRFFVEKKTRQLDIFGVGIGCGLIIGLLPVSEKQGLQLRKKNLVKKVTENCCTARRRALTLWYGGGRKVMNSMFLALSQSALYACAVMTTQLWERALPILHMKIWTVAPYWRKALLLCCAIRAGLISYFHILETCAGFPGIAERFYKSNFS